MFIPGYFFIAFIYGSFGFWLAFLIVFGFCVYFTYVSLRSISTRKEITNRADRGCLLTIPDIYFLLDNQSLLTTQDERYKIFRKYLPLLEPDDKQWIVSKGIDINDIDSWVHKGEIWSNFCFDSAMKFAREKHRKEDNN